MLLLQFFYLVAFITCLAEQIAIIETELLGCVICMFMGDWLSGRAPRSHRGGRQFDSVIAHHWLVDWCSVYVGCGYLLVGSCVHMLMVRVLLIMQKVRCCLPVCH